MCLLFLFAFIKAFKDIEEIKKEISVMTAYLVKGDGDIIDVLQEIAEMDDAECERLEQQFKARNIFS